MSGYDGCPSCQCQGVSVVDRVSGIAISVCRFSRDAVLPYSKVNCYGFGLLRHIHLSG